MKINILRKFIVFLFIFLCSSLLFSEIKINSNGITNISSSLLGKGESIDLKYCRYGYETSAGEGFTNLVLANDKLNLDSHYIDDSQDGLRAVQFHLDYRKIRPGEKVSFTSGVYGYFIFDYGKFKLDVKEFEPFIFDENNLVLNIRVKISYGCEQGEILISYAGKMERWDYFDLWDDTRNKKSSEEVKAMKERMKIKNYVHLKKRSENKIDGYSYVMMLTDDLELGRDEKYVYVTSEKLLTQIVFVCEDKMEYSVSHLMRSFVKAVSWGSEKPFLFWDWSEGIVRAYTKKYDRKESVFDAHFNIELDKYYVNYRDVYGYFNE